MAGTSEREGHSGGAQADYRLVRDAMGGNQSAAQQLIEDHKDRLFAFVLRLVGNHHEAEDVTQDAFLRAFAALDRFNGQNRFSTWIFTIAYRISLNRIRRKPHASFDAAQIDPSADDPDVSDELANSEEARRFRSAIWREVDKLGPRQKAAVLLFYQQGLRCQEIGEILRVPTATVKSHLHRARMKLRDRLAGRLVDDWTGIRFAGEAS
jgi:RNA polymerase sigma-70 factor (ECF subfamily)